MFHVVLYRPEIPPNTGNVIRLCANTGRVKRAGLDYHEFADVRHHASWQACMTALSASRIFAVETRQAVRYDRIEYQRGDAFVFGQETSGLPEEVLSGIPPARRVWLPMRPEMRSLNLSNSVAVMVFEAWRQIDFAGSA